jgi:nucleotide-binding universal stress UspA family protein
VAAGITKVGVALDGSELAESALEEGERLARSMGASMLLIRAVVPPAGLYGAELVPGSLPVLEQLETDAREYLEGVAEHLTKLGLEVGVAVALGPFADAILEAARENDIDLIVMTTHGRSGLERWAFGSVADAVVRRGELPVMVIRPPEVAAEGALENVTVAGNVVVPPPSMTERRARTAVEPKSPGVRPHRPEREPGR